MKSQMVKFYRKLKWVGYIFVNIQVNKKITKSLHYFLYSLHLVLNYRYLQDEENFGSSPFSIEWKFSPKLSIFTLNIIEYSKLN